MATRAVAWLFTRMPQRSELRRRREISNRWPRVRQFFHALVRETYCTKISGACIFTFMAGRTIAIARNAFREAVRDRVLYNLILFALLLIGSAIFLGELSAGQEAKIIVDLGLSAMLLFGVFIAIFVGVGLVYKEIERRTLYAILSKPIGRGQFLVGKYLGLSLTLLVNVIVMGGGVTLALVYVQRGWNPLAGKIWPAILLIYFELLIITAVALVFSSFSSPALSALLTFFVFIIGHFSADLKVLANASGSRSEERRVGKECR